MIRAGLPGADRRLPGADPDLVHGASADWANRPQLSDPRLSGGAQLSTVMLVIIGIVGTTVAPWQLFFQRSYVIDKRITPRFMSYEKVDLWIGIGIIGAAAVGLSTPYALGDALGLKHSLHRKPKEAKGFYAIFVALLAVVATVVLIPGSPLGLLTVGVQTLAGVLLPSAVVFLLLLCNDTQVLGPWVDGKWLNIFTSAVIAIQVMLSLVLTARHGGCRRWRC